MLTFTQFRLLSNAEINEVFRTIRNKPSRVSLSRRASTFFEPTKRVTGFSVGQKANMFFKPMRVNRQGTSLSQRAKTFFKIRRTKRFL